MENKYMKEASVTIIEPVGKTGLIWLHRKSLDKFVFITWLLTDHFTELPAEMLCEHGDVQKIHSYDKVKTMLVFQNICQK